MYDIEIIEDSISEKVCYICFEPCSTRSNCKCQDIYVHKECLIRYIKFSHKKTCSICLEEYNDIDIKNKITYNPTRLCYIYIVSYVFFVIYIWIGGFMIYTGVSFKQGVSKDLLISFGGVFIMISILGIYNNIKTYIIRIRNRQYLRQQVTDTIVTIIQ